MPSTQQSTAIIDTLKAAGLKYQEVYEELIDHYSTAIDVKTEEGKSFEEALKEVHTDFGGNKGIKHIEERYNKQLFRFYRNLHLKNIGNHFRWPQALGTLIIGGLVYYLSHLLQGNIFLLYGLSLLALLPFAISIYYFFRLRKEANYTKKTAKGNMLIGISGYALNFLNLLIFVPRVFLNQTTGKEILLYYPAFVAVVITLYLIYLLSFIKTLEQVPFKTT